MFKGVFPGGPPCQPLFTLIFDREGASPDFFREMDTHRVAILADHKFAGPDWIATVLSLATTRSVCTAKIHTRSVRVVGWNTVPSSAAFTVNLLLNSAIYQARKN